MENIGCCLTVGATAGAYASDKLGLNGRNPNPGQDLGRAAVNAGANALAQITIRGGKVNWQQVATDTILNFTSSRLQGYADDKRAETAKAANDAQIAKAKQTLVVGSNASSGINLNEVTATGVSLNNAQREALDKQWQAAADKLPQIPLGYATASNGQVTPLLFGNDASAGGDAGGSIAERTARTGALVVDYVGKAGDVGVAFSKDQYMKGIPSNASRSATNFAKEGAQQVKVLKPQRQFDLPMLDYIGSASQANGSATTGFYAKNGYPRIQGVSNIAKNWWDGGVELTKLASDGYQYLTGGNRSVITNQFYPESATLNAINSQGGIEFTKNLTKDLVFGTIISPIRFVDGLVRGDANEIGSSGAVLIGTLAGAGLAGKASGASAGLRTSTVVSAERAEAFLIKNGVKPETAKAYLAEVEGPITARLVRPGESFLRYYDFPKASGDFLTKTQFTNPSAAIDGLNLGSYGNNATLVQSVTSINRNIVIEGGIKNGSQGVTQTLIIPNRSAYSFGVGTQY